MNRNEKSRLIQLVKIGQKQLGIDDLSYRAMLKRITGKESATKCNIVELHKMLHELKQKGAKITYFAKKPLNATAYSPATGSQTVKSELAHKIRAIWINMGKAGFVADRSETGLNKFIQQMLNRGRKKKGEMLLLVHVHTLNQRQATSVLEALKSWHKREMLNRLTTMGCLMAKESRYEDVVLQFLRYQGVK